MISLLEDIFLNNTVGAYFCWGILLSLIGFIIWLVRIASKDSLQTKLILKQLSELEASKNSSITQIKSDSTTWENYKQSLIEVEQGDQILHQRTTPSSVLINPNTVNPKLFRGYFLTWIPSVLTTIGVLGTFIGLSIGLKGLKLETGSHSKAPSMERVEQEGNNSSPAVEDNGREEIDEMLNGIKELISGAKTAFYTSILGVLAGITFGIALRATRQCKANKIEDLSNILDRLITEVSSEEDLREIKNSNEHSSNHLKELIEQIGPKLQETLTAMPAQIGNAIGEEIKGAVSSIGTQSATDLGGAFQNLYDEHLKDLSGLAQAIQQQVQVTNAITERLNLLPEKLESSSQNLEKGAHSLHLVSEKFGNWDSSLLKYSETVSSSSELFDQASGNLSKAANTIEQAIPSLEGAAGNIAQTATNTKTTIDEDTTKLTQSFADVVEVMSGFKATSENLPKVASELSAASRDLKKLSKSMQAGHEAQQKASENNQNAAISFNKVSTNFEDTAKHLSQLGSTSENLNKAGIAAKMSFESLRDLLGEIKTLNTSFTHLSNSMKDITNQEIGQQFSDATRSLNEASGKLESLSSASSSLENASEVAVGVFGQASREHEAFVEGLTVGVKSLAEQVQSLLGQYENGLRESTKTRINDWNTEASNFGAQFKSQANNLHSAIEELQDSINARI